MAKSRQRTLDKMAVYDAARPADQLVTFHLPNPGPVAGGWGIRLVGMGFGYVVPPPFVNSDAVLFERLQLTRFAPNFAHANAHATLAR
jgi:ATP-binding cassette subfamily F protein 3